MLLEQLRGYSGAYKDEYAMRLAQGRTLSHVTRNTYFTNFKEDVMSLAEKAAAKAAALRAKKSNKKEAPAATKKAAAKKSDKKKNGKSVTPRAESKTAKILDMLKSGSSREKIRAKYDMEKLSDVGWYISKFKAKGLLPKSFERE